MKVFIKSFDVEMQIKKKGIELEVRANNGGEQLGDCYATMVGLVWCKGKIQKSNGIKMSWNDFMTICASKESMKAAIAAAKQTEKD